MEDDALRHRSLGLPARTMTASDEARARNDTKAAVEMVYIIKQTLNQRGFIRLDGSIPSMGLHFIPACSPSFKDRRMPPKRVFTYSISADE